MQAEAGKDPRVTQWFTPAVVQPCKLKLFFRLTTLPLESLSWTIGVVPDTDQTNTPLFCSWQVRLQTVPNPPSEENITK